MFNINFKLIKVFPIQCPIHLLNIYITDTDLSSCGLHGDDVALSLVEDLDRNSNDRHLDC